MFLKMGFCTRFVPKQTRQKISSFGDRLTQLWLSLHGVPILNSINTNLCQTFWRITPQRKTPRTYCEKSFLSKRQACNSFDFLISIAWRMVRSCEVQNEWEGRVVLNTGNSNECPSRVIIGNCRLLPNMAHYSGNTICDLPTVKRRDWTRHEHYNILHMWSIHCWV